MRLAAVGMMALAVALIGSAAFARIPWPDLPAQNFERCLASQPEHLIVLKRAGGPFNGDKGRSLWTLYPDAAYSSASHWTVGWYGGQRSKGAVLYANIYMAQSIADAKRLAHVLGGAKQPLLRYGTVVVVMTLFPAAKKSEAALLQHKAVVISCAEKDAGSSWVAPVVPVPGRP